MQYFLGYNQVMHPILEGYYQNGSIRVKNVTELKENSLIRFYVLSNDQTVVHENLNKALGAYHLGKSMDQLNIRDLAHD
jgi:hypothetical protein